MREVRIHFQARPWDLYVTLGYAVLVSSVLVVLGRGYFLAIPLVLFATGYVVTASLFPQKQEIDWIERFVLSVGLSLAVVPPLGLLLSATPPGISFGSIVLSVLLLTLVFGLVALRRRLALAVGDRLSLTVVIGPAHWTDLGILDKGLAIGLAIGLVLAGALAFLAVTTPRPVARYTEIYLLDANRTTAHIPSRLNVSQSATVFAVVGNHEAETVNYTVRVDLVGIAFVYNATGVIVNVTELNRTTWSTYNFTLDDGQTWIQNYTFSVSRPGLWQVQFLLFKRPDVVMRYVESYLVLHVGIP